MDAITRNAVRLHLETATDALAHANSVPVDVSLIFLTEARDNLGAAIDTIEQARKEAAEIAANRRRLPSLTTIGRAESLQALAESHLADTSLTQLIHQAGHPA